MIVSRKMAEEAWASLMAYWAFSEEERPVFEGLRERDVSVAYRAAARRSHPDAGGRVEDFAAVDRAKHVLLAWLAKQSPATNAHGGVDTCPRCDGTGRITLQKGFRQMQIQCPTCKGSGELSVERERGGDKYDA